MDVDDYLALAVILLVVMNMIQATIILKFSDLVGDLRDFLNHHGGGHKADRIMLIFEDTMATVAEGATVPFVVVGLNKKGNPVPLTDATVTTDDPAVATATVNADGTGGVLTGVVAGTDNLNAAAAGKTAVEAVTVTPDTAVDSIKIVVG